MIASDCDIKTFIKCVKDRDYREIILLADKEATEAERNDLGRKRGQPVSECGKEYAKQIKCLIFYILYRIRLRGINEDVYSMLETIPKERYLLFH